MTGRLILVYTERAGGVIRIVGMCDLQRRYLWLAVSLTGAVAQTTFQDCYRCADGTQFIVDFSSMIPAHLQLGGKAVSTPARAWRCLARAIQAAA